MWKKNAFKRFGISILKRREHSTRKLANEWLFFNLFSFGVEIREGKKDKSDGNTNLEYKLWEGKEKKSQNFWIYGIFKGREKNFICESTFYRYNLHKSFHDVSEKIEANFKKEINLYVKVFVRFFMYHDIDVAETFLERFSSSIKRYDSVSLEFHDNFHMKINFPWVQSSKIFIFKCYRCKSVQNTPQLQNFHLSLGRTI